MASYDAIIKLVVQGEEALVRIQKRIDSLYKTINALETKKKYAGSEAAVKFVKEQANELERVAQVSRQIIKQDEQRIVQQSRLNAAIDLYERRSKQVVNSGATELKKFQAQIQDIEQAFAFFRDRKNVAGVQALATELGRMVEYANAVNKSERERADNLSKLRGFAKELARYEELGLSTRKARERFDQLALVADTNKTTEAKKYTEALVRQLSLLKEQAVALRQSSKETEALQQALKRLEVKSAAEQNALLQARGEVAALAARGVAASKYAAAQPTASLMLPAYQERGLQVLTNSVKLNESQLRIEQALNGERARGVRFLEKQSAEEARQVELGILGQRTNRLGGVPAAALPMAAQYAQPIGPVGRPGTRLAGALQGAGMPTFAAGVRGIGQGLTPGRRAETLRGAVGSAIIGGGFPLLFGQGPEAAVGGAVGGALGGLIGGPMGFALSIAGTALGELLAKQKELTEEVRNEAITRGQVAASMNQQLANAEKLLSTKKTLQGLDLQIAEASAAGNEQLQIELQYQKELEQINSDRLEAIRQAAQDQNTASGEQFKRAMDVANAEAENSRHVAKRVKQLQLATREYQAQVTEIRHQAQLTQGIIDAEKQRVSNQASLVEARSQAEIAVNNVILQRLEHELQSTTNAKDRARLIKEIYNLEVANARATYQATVARIEAQVRLVELAVEEQEQKYLSLQVEKQLAIHLGKSTEALDKALEIQGQAVDKARDNLKYAVEIAKEQLRAADATFQSAVYAAKLKAEMSATAKASGQYADNMQRAAAATEDQLRAAVPDYRKMVGITGDPMSGLIASNRPRISFRNLMENDYTKAVQQLKAFKDYEQAVQRYEEFQQYGIRGVPKPSKPAGYDMYEMRAAIERYTPSQSATTPINPQVNVTTGPVMQMDGTNYVTQRDLMSATQSAARQGASMALGQLERDPATRRRVGVMR